MIKHSSCCALGRVFSFFFFLFFFFFSSLQNQNPPRLCSSPPPPHTRTDDDPMRADFPVAPGAAPALLERSERGDLDGEPRKLGLREPGEAGVVQRRAPGEGPGAGAGGGAAGTMGLFVYISLVCVWVAWGWLCVCWVAWGRLCICWVCLAALEAETETYMHMHRSRVCGLCHGVVVVVVGWLVI
jgi:hypothetical protein